MDYRNFFNENSQRYEERYSTMVIIAFIYYAFGYYILEIQERCEKLIDWKKLAIGVVAHIIQLGIAYRYYINDQIMYAWGVIFVPLIIFVLVKQYMNSYRKKAYMKMKAYIQKKEALEDSGPMFNRDTTATGLQNEQLRREQDRGPQTEILGVPPQQMSQLRMDQLRSGNVSAYGDYTQYDPDYEQQQLNQRIKGGGMFSSF